MTTTFPRIVVAGVSSGAGKTTITSALARTFRRRGLEVRTFKCGPDYLDPTYHGRASGAPSHNLDSWMMGKEGVLDTFRRAAEGADVSLLEGVMGLFDGADVTSDQASTAQIAKWLDAPVLVVVDASGMARTLGAIALGLTGYDPDVLVRGLLCNRVGSRGHLDLLRGTKPLAVPVLGGLPKSEATAFPERHLGLVTARDGSLPERVFDDLADLAEMWLSPDRVLELARGAAPLPALAPARDVGAPRCRIGVAHDEAFHFYYDDNLARLRAEGAELVFFSPIRDPSLPPVDGLYIGGGYPEAHAEQLAHNESMRAEIRAFADAGAPIYSECGGLMYLARALRTTAEDVHPMAGVLDATVTMKERLVALGYVEVETTAPTLLGPTGTRFRGHQFRYSDIEAAGDLKRAYRVHRRRDRTASDEGFARGNVVASYVHAHWASNATIPRAFVDACTTFRQRRS